MPSLTYVRIGLMLGASLKRTAEQEKDKNMPTSSYSMSIRDYSRELASFQFPITEVTAGNLPGLLTLGGALETAVQNVILGVEAKKKMVAFENLDVSIPANATAQRELAWVVHYHDDEAFFDAPTNSIPNENYGAKETMRIPTAKVTDNALLQPNSDLAALTEARWIAFISAFEGFVLSRGGGDVKIDYIELSRGAK